MAGGDRRARQRLVANTEQLVSETTALTLAMADSIAEVNWDLDDQARRYVRWWRDGAYSVTGICFDIGGTTVRPLRRFADLVRTDGARPAARQDRFPVLSRSASTGLRHGSGDMPS
jgi:hypothetical protein